MSEDDWAPAAPIPPAGAPGSGSGGGGQVRVEGYVDLVEIARGGDSIVYRAHQRTVGRDVAIKVISVADEATLARFRRELAITVQLGRQHPNIINVLDTTETADGQPCLVMDFHDLGSLHDRLVAHGPLPVSEVVDAGTAVADALTFAHRAGVLHRDVKPQNILLLPTSYVLSDFGIARMADSGHTATMDRFSYRHASPEVLDGREPTEADDVWSLGSTLFTLLDGRPPFAADDPVDDTALAYLRRVRTAARRPLGRTDLPAGLRELIEGCLRPRPEERLGSAAEALAALRGLRTEDRSWDPEARQQTGGPTVREVEDAHDGDDVEAAQAAEVEAVEAVGDGGTVEDAEAVEDGGDVTPPRPTSATVDAAPTGLPPEISTPAPETSARSEPSSPGPEAFAPPAEPSAPHTETSAPRPEPSAPRPVPPSPASGRAAVAPSALAHVSGPVAATEADAEATGMLPEQMDDGSADPPKAAAPATGSDNGTPHPWRRILVFLSGAVLAGAALGVGFQIIRQSTAPEQPPAPTPIEMEVPVDPGPLPTEDGPDQAPVGDQRFAPQSLVLVDRGTSAHLSWSPPSQDVDYYLVVLVGDEGGTEVVQMVSAESTEYQVQGLDPDRANECFAVVGYAEQEGRVHTGSSDLECR